MTHRRLVSAVVGAVMGCSVPSALWAEAPTTADLIQRGEYLVRHVAMCVQCHTPRFHRTQLVRPAYVTLHHNGIVVHSHTALLGPTQHRQVAAYRPHPPSGPPQLQDHGARVRYRNVWCRPLKDYDEL
jgi:hypothetical protein